MKVIFTAHLRRGLINIVFRDERKIEDFPFENWRLYDEKKFLCIKSTPRRFNVGINRGYVYESKCYYSTN
ncbi:hypothetical protein PUN28_000358 [Cardiocondyla obscurior]|uniref:Uncharacterized protein n=1 Tax=Cardiocondyla obscurior TaxID=286306 RepID=A0AAW2GZ26_9HYME